MKIQILEDYESMSVEAARMVASRIKENPQLVLGLATGSTPVGMYEELVKLYEAHQVSFKEVTTFNLDEYYPIDRNHPNSYYSYMQEHLWSKVDLKKENVHIPDSKPEDPLKACRQYEEKIAARGGIDFQVLGIGPNGHIGFNEPGEYLQAQTHLVNLTEETIKANSRFFKSMEEVPKQAITMGIGTIMKAKEILLLVSGEHKAEIIKKALQGPITTQIPASILQAHPRVTVLLDKEAGKLL